LIHGQVYFAEFTAMIVTPSHDNNGSCQEDSVAAVEDEEHICSFLTMNFQADLSNENDLPSSSGSNKKLLLFSQHHYYLLIETNPGKVDNAALLCRFKPAMNMPTSPQSKCL
jgi:hypothetical protein